MPEDKDGPPSPGPGSEKSKGMLRPTMIKAPVGEATMSITGRRKETQPKKPTRPTMIPGVERKRIRVDESHLKAFSPDTEPKISGDTARLLRSFVIEQATDRSAILWGHRLQQDYSELVSRSLSLSQADLVERVTGYLNRMMEILGSIDIEAVCGLGTSLGVLSQYLKKINNRIDTPRELEAARSELDQLVKLTGRSLEPLLALKENIERQSSHIDEMGDEVEASALAAEYLSAHLRDKEPKLSQLFLERSMSLTQTVAQIRGSVVMRETQVEGPLRLIGVIQNVALVMIPGWLEGIASLLVTAQGGPKPTPTEARELIYGLRDILHQLGKRK